jgi:hypothetical protein
MESTENDRTVFRPSHKTLKIEKTDFHIPTATTTTEQSFHLKTRKTGPDNRSHLSRGAGTSPIEAFGRYSLYGIVSN